MIKPIIALFIFLGLTNGTSSHINAKKWQLVWNDEFNGQSLDLSKWKFDSLGDRRGGINTKNNIKVENGSLKIHTSSIKGKHYTSMISTEDSYHPLYGYFEARVKFNPAPGLWSNFWLYSQDMGKYRDRLDKCGMEVDIFEHRLTNGEGKDYQNSIIHCIHWDGYSEHHRANMIIRDNVIKDGFNVIALEWTPDKYTFFVNGKKTWSTKPVTSRPMFILFSSELGYDWWAGKIPENGYNNEFVVDYVRHYQLQEKIK